MLVGAMMFGAVSAQVLEAGEPALIYYSPKTSVVLDFTYTVETFEPGIYAEYAELLGATTAITEQKTIYRIEDVQISTNTSADYTRPHKVSAESGIPMLLQMNEKGILRGYNTTLEEKKPFAPKPHTDPRPTTQNRNRKMKVLPYTDDILNATDVETQAGEVAKQIFHLRETRMYLLSGEVEHAPADGKSMELVLDELDRQERALIDLFMGRHTKKKEHKKVTFSSIARPENACDTIRTFQFFSEENGFTNGDNIDADTVSILICLHAAQFKAVETVEDPKKAKKKSEPELSPITYNLPGNAEVIIRCPNGLHRSRTVQMAQLGIDVPLPKSLFTGKELPKITFSEKTGNIVKIER